MRTTGILNKSLNGKTEQYDGAKCIDGIIAALLVFHFPTKVLQ